MTTMRIPEALNQGEQLQTTIQYLHSHYRDFRLNQEKGAALDTVEAERYACGFPIPPFQRDQVWTHAQEVAFLESVWLRLPIGTFTHHKMDWRGNQARPFSGWLIDGQQRLTTIERYWEDRIPVFGFYWSELNKVEQRRFWSVPFPHFQPALWDEVAIRDLYNRLALGGTPHQESDRATLTL